MNCDTFRDLIVYCSKVFRQQTNAQTLSVLNIKMYRFQEFTVYRYITVMEQYNIGSVEPEPKIDIGQNFFSLVTASRLFRFL